MIGGYSSSNPSEPEVQTRDGPVASSSGQDIKGYWCIPSVLLQWDICGEPCT